MCEYHNWGFSAAEASTAQIEAVRFFAHFAEGELGRSEAVATFRADEYSRNPSFGAKAGAVCSGRGWCPAGLQLAVERRGTVRPGSGDGD